MWRKMLKTLTGLTLLAGVATAGYLTRDIWLPYFTLSKATNPREEKKPVVTQGGTEQVKLSPQAQSNLKLIAKPLQPDTYWRTITLPGMIIDRPGQSDRGIVAPMAGVVTHIQALPGDSVTPGQTLFSLRLQSDALYQSQTELFKTAQEIQLTQQKKQRMSSPDVVRAIPEATLIELDHQLRRLEAVQKAYRQELSYRGLDREQIDGVAEGRFVSEITIRAPSPKNNLRLTDAAAVPTEPAVTQVQELKVDLGQQVQAGQTLCLLSNHQLLLIEGRAFRQDTALLEQAAKEAWPVQVEFLEDAVHPKKEEKEAWPPLKQSFEIRSIANTMDPASRTFGFYVPLTNQYRTYQRDGQTLLFWRYRPGQRVRLQIRVEKFENVFVLPAAAVVREGAETYVFRQNGDLFERKPVRVLMEERQFVVIANDGSVPAGIYVAQSSAAQLNRVLKSQSGQAPAGFHVHADGSVHANH